MKKVLLVLLVALIAIPTFQSCKKGENDPISLKSRKARLVGEWNLSAGTMTMVDVSGGVTDTYIVNFNGTTVSGTYNGTAWGPNTYSQTVVIEKDGTYKNTVTDDGDVTVKVGQWYFMGANEDNEIKDKEVVAFVVTQSTYTPSGGTASTSTYVSLNPDETWQLDKLSSKEIIVLINDVETYAGGSSYTQIGTMTYTK